MITVTEEEMCDIICSSIISYNFLTTGKCLDDELIKSLSENTMKSINNEGGEFIEELKDIDMVVNFFRKIESPINKLREIFTQSFKKATDNLDPESRDELIKKLKEMKENIDKKDNNKNKEGNNE